MIYLVKTGKEAAYNVYAERVNMKALFLSRLWQKFMKFRETVGNPL